jgi:adenine-specific DNA-methyltransferase
VVEEVNSMSASSEAARAEHALLAQPDAAKALRAFLSLAREVTPGNAGKARSFCSTVLEEYWRSACGSLSHFDSSLSSCPVPVEPLAAKHLPRARAAAEAAHQLPKPLAAYLLGSLYTSMLPEEARAANGAFYTPPPVVDRLLDMVEQAGFDWSRGTLIDPSCGAGAFLCGAALRMVDALERKGVPPARVLERVSQHLSGVEIDPFAGWMAHVFLEVALWSYCRKARKRLPVRITFANTLQVSVEDLGKHDLVVGNPPYGKVSLPPQQRNRFARSLYGHANLYGVFTDLAVELARPSGIIAYVTPASFLGGQYFHRLRQLLGESAPPHAIDFITDRSGVFKDVLQETVLAVFRREPAGGRNAVTVHFTQATAPDRPCGTTRIGHFPLPERPAQPWLLPRDARQALLLKNAARKPWRLSDYGVDVSTGPLVWNRHKDQLSQEEGPRCHPLIWAEAVLPDGTFRYSATRRNHQPYLRLKEQQGHLLIREEAVLVQRTTAKEQQRRLIAALMPRDFVARHKGVTVENHLNVIRASPTLLSLGEARGKGTYARAHVTLRAIAALLNSSITDQLFRCISGSVAVSAYELESLPVIAVEDMHRLEELLAAGALDAELERFILKAYGMSS